MEYCCHLWSPENVSLVFEQIEEWGKTSLRSCWLTIFHWLLDETCLSSVSLSANAGLWFVKLSLKLRSSEVRIWSTRWRAIILALGSVGWKVAQTTFLFALFGWGINHTFLFPRAVQFISFLDKHLREKIHWWQKNCPRDES